jgi:hypothetical protein
LSDARGVPSSIPGVRYDPRDNRLFPARAFLLLVLLALRELVDEILDIYDILPFLTLAEGGSFGIGGRLSDSVGEPRVEPKRELRAVLGDLSHDRLERVDRAVDGVRTPKPRRRLGTIEIRLGKRRDRRGGLVETRERRGDEGVMTSGDRGDIGIDIGDFAISTSKFVSTMRVGIDCSTGG